MAENINIYIDQATTFVVEFQIFDETSANNSVEDYDFIARMKKVFSSTNPDVPFSIGKDNDRITVSLSANTTENIEPGKYYYDIVMIDNSNGATTKIVEGLAFVLETMSR